MREYYSQFFAALRNKLTLFATAAVYLGIQMCENRMNNNHLLFSMKSILLIGFH